MMVIPAAIKNAMRARLTYRPCAAIAPTSRKSPTGKHVIVAYRKPSDQCR